MPVRRPIMGGGAGGGAAIIARVAPSAVRAGTPAAARCARTSCSVANTSGAAREQRGRRRREVRHHDRRHAGGERRRARRARSPRARRSRRGATPSRAAASRKMSGAGLPRAISSPPTSATKRGEQLGAARASPARARRRVDVATAVGIALAFEPVEQLDEPGLEARCPRARRSRRRRRARRPSASSTGIAGAVVRADQRPAVAGSCGR